MNISSRYLFLPVLLFAGALAFMPQGAFAAQFCDDECQSPYTDYDGWGNPIDACGSWAHVCNEVDEADGEAEIQNFANWITSDQHVAEGGGGILTYDDSGNLVGATCINGASVQFIPDPPAPPPVVTPPPPDPTPVCLAHTDICGYGTYGQCSGSVDYDCNGNYSGGSCDCPSAPVVTPPIDTPTDTGGGDPYTPPADTGGCTDPRGCANCSLSGWGPDANGDCAPLDSGEEDDSQEPPAPPQGCRDAVSAAITAVPNRVHLNGTALLTWSATGITGTCTISGPNFTTQTVTPSCDIASTSMATGPITAQSTYTIDCGTASSKAKVIVNLAPGVTEF